MSDAPERIWVDYRMAENYGVAWSEPPPNGPRAEEAEYIRADLVQAAVDEQRGYKDAAYLERNKLVALLASLFPSGIKRTAIEGWSDDWHGCVYIDFPWGQASWHYHDSQADLFAHLPLYQGEWDGHTTEAKYAAIVTAALRAKAKEAGE